MRVLFVQAARQNAPEYGNHRRHARNAPDYVTSYFIRQAADGYKPGRSSFQRRDSGNHYFFEMGRNLTLRPRPNKAQRALMMGLAMPLSLPQIIRTARYLRPDVIYSSQQKEDVPLARLLSHLLGVPHVLALHYPVGPWLGKPTLAFLRHSQRLVAVSDYVRHTAIEYGVDPEKIRVVPNSMQIDPFLQVQDGRPVRREFQIPQSAPLISSIGRLDPTKGHAELLQALAQVHETAPDARLIICGQPFNQPDYDEFLKEEAQRLGVADRVIFAGYREDIPAILAASDLFCLPTHDEAFGNVFVEAMASCLPVVAYRSGGVPEIVVHGETGFLAEEDDVDGLARHLERLLTDSKLARRMGAAGRERVKQQFVPAVRAPHWAETVQALL